MIEKVKLYQGDFKGSRIPKFEKSFYDRRLSKLDQDSSISTDNEK